MQVGIGTDYKGAAKGILEVEELFYILIVVMIMMICTYQNSWNSTVKGINFTVCKLYLNKNSITNHNIVLKRKHDEYKDMRQLKQYLVV